MEDKIAPLDWDRRKAEGIEIDAAGLTAAAGFIDCQINGGRGIDLTTSTEAIWQLGDELPRYGVTSFLPTLITAPDGTVQRGMQAIKRRPPAYSGAEPLGLHLEGPMLNKERRGAHPEEYLRQPSPGLVATWTRDRGVALVTLSPELPGALEVIQQLAEGGVVVSAGHTEATADEAIRAVDAGMTAVTHVFNAMSPLHHRRSDLISVALTNPSLTVGLIADGVHVSPTVVELVWRAKGPDQLMLVTDAMAAMGTDGGDFALGEAPVNADSTGARRPDGRLAGSTSSMVEAVQNLVSFTSASPWEALRCASATPSRLLGLSDRGELEAGRTADVVLLDERMEVAVTICRGKVSYVADNERWRLRNLGSEGGSHWT